MLEHQRTGKELFMSKYIRNNGKNKVVVIAVIAFIIITVLWLALEGAARAEKPGVLVYPMTNQHITWTYAGGK